MNEFKNGTDEPESKAASIRSERPKPASERPAEIGHQSDTEPSVTSPNPLETRTTGSVRHCKRCGDSIVGRRRNGFCSDRCRMAVQRQGDAERRRKLCADLKQTLTAIEQELLCGSSRNEGGDQ